MPRDLSPYDALLVVSFGGPERRDDVLPFLENVVRGKPVPRERLLAVAEHYYHFGGVSPINAQNRELIVALEQELAAHDMPLPVYFGNRNWHPLLADTLLQMANDGVRRALALFTTAYSSYSSCRQYRENIAAAQERVQGNPPRVDKLRAFYNHPGFVAAVTDRTQAALDELPADRRSGARLVFTAHSIPTAMAEQCRYAEQLAEAARLVAESLGHNPWDMVYQSRSGPPQQPWLEPDVCDHLRRLAASGITDVVIVPIGFLTDHLEVLYDLDVEARLLCEQLGLQMVRAACVGTHPRFIRMLRELIVERVATEQGHSPERLAIGRFGPSHDVCPIDCCLPGTRPAAR